MMKLFPFIIHHSAFIVSLLLFSFRQPAPVGRSPNAAHVDRSAAYARDDEEGEKLKWVAEACEAGERGDERADAEPQHNEAGREDFCHEQNHAEHNPDDPDVVFHQPLSASALRAAIWAEQRARLSPQPLSMFFSTNQTLAGRSARRRMKYGYQVLP